MTVVSWVSGPTEINMTCCYQVTTMNGCVVIGRPFIVDEEALIAELVHGDSDWSDASPTVADLPSDMRAAVAAEWAHDGLYEHASIASFSRFALALMVLGAPAELVKAAHEAALDEVRHAQRCFALASAYGAPVAPGRLPIPSTLAVPQSLVDLAVSTAIEGCIGETIASIVAHEQRARATDPTVRAALDGIADDEMRHAELAWRTVAWAIERGGSAVRSAVADVFRSAGAHLPSFEAGDDARLEAHGRLSRATLQRVKRQALDEVVLPCAAALLAREQLTREQPVHVA
jgi:hypothetical protein